MRKVIVDEKFDQKNLNQFLNFCFPNLKQNQFFKALRQKDIKINGARVKENLSLNKGDIVEVYIADEFLLGKAIDVQTVFEDENILVVNKPAGISVTEEAQANSVYLSKLIQEKWGKNVVPCHRLDRNTRGLVLFAKNKETEKILLEKFKNQEIEKHYKAIVYGIPKEDHKVLTDYLFKDSKKNMVYISNEFKKGYKKIVTEYTVIHKNIQENIAELDVNLHTGKTHQIRAHLAFLGYPIIGDEKYGNHLINKKMGKTTQELESYMIIFCFKTDAGILNYLNHQKIMLE